MWTPIGMPKRGLRHVAEPLVSEAATGCDGCGCTSGLQQCSPSARSCGGSGRVRDRGRSVVTTRRAGGAEPGLGPARRWGEDQIAAEPPACSVTPGCCGAWARRCPAAACRGEQGVGPAPVQGRCPQSSPEQGASGPWGVVFLAWWGVVLSHARPRLHSRPSPRLPDGWLLVQRRGRVGHWWRKRRDHRQRRTDFRAAVLSQDSLTTSTRRSPRPVV